MLPYVEIRRFLETGEYPETFTTKDQKRALRRRSAAFRLDGEDLVYIRKGRKKRVIPTRCEQQKVIEEAHRGHPGLNKTTDLVSLRFYWETITADVKRFVESCDQCQRVNPSLKAGLVQDLHPVPVKLGPFRQWGIDLIGPLKESARGNKYIVLSTCYFSKWQEGASLPSKEGIGVARFISNNIIFRYGAPEVLISDQGREFCNKVNDAIFSLFGTEHRLTSSYHPQSNGLQERNNQTIQKWLQKSCNEAADDWDDQLPLVLHTYNTTVHSSTKFSPYFIIYGRHPQLSSEKVKQNGTDSGSKIPAAEDYSEFMESMEEHRQAIFSQAMSNIGQVQKKQKADYAKKHSPENIEVDIGAKVLIRNNRKSNRKLNKLSAGPNWLGPYTIDKITQNRLVILKNGKGETLKKAFNLSQIREYKERKTNPEEFQEDGGNREEFQEDGGDREEFQEDGGNREEFQEDGGDREEFQEDGGDREEFQEDGGNREEFQEDGGDREEFQEDGGDREEFQEDGGDREEFQEDGGNREEFQEDGGDREEFQEDGGNREADQDDRVCQRNLAEIKLPRKRKRVIVDEDSDTEDTVIDCVSNLEAEGTIIDCTSDSEPFTAESKWVESLNLTWADREIVMMAGGWLTDVHIETAQELLRAQFPLVSGFQTTTFAQSDSFVAQCEEYVQILHVGGNHWVCITSVGVRDPSVCHLYDSLASRSYDIQFWKDVSRIQRSPGPNVVVKVENFQRQPNFCDCGLFAIAAATSICHGLCPSMFEYDVSAMRRHLVDCFECGVLSPFPSTERNCRIPLAFQLKHRVYCICRGVNDGRQMIQCDGWCKGWFHSQCVNGGDFNPEEKLKWKCEICS